MRQDLYMGVRAFLFLAILFTALGFSKPPASSPVAHYRYRILHTYPHPPNLFTEGLEYKGGVLYESSGRYGQSVLVEENLKTGVILKQINVDPSVFGEGITLLNNRLYEVTWESQLGFIYDAATLKQTGTFHYTGEGWGMTNDGQTIYLSDGTPAIRCLDPKTLALKRTITVHDGSQEIKMVNELEWVKGQLFANIWHEDRIARIDPTSGRVTAWVDISGLRPKDATDNEAVPNGIAYDTATNHFLLTGKLWTKVFEVEFVPQR